MKKPGLIDTAVRLFPDKEFDAATTRTTIKGHVTGRLYYSPLKSKKNLISRILKKGLALCAFCIEVLEKALKKGKITKFVSHFRFWKGLIEAQFERNQ